MYFIGDWFLSNVTHEYAKLKRETARQKKISNREVLFVRGPTRHTATEAERPAGSRVDMESQKIPRDAVYLVGHAAKASTPKLTILSKVRH